MRLRYQRCEVALSTLRGCAINVTRLRYQRYEVALSTLRGRAIDVARSRYRPQQLVKARSLPSVTKIREWIVSHSYFTKEQAFTRTYYIHGCTQIRQPSVLPPTSLYLYSSPCKVHQEKDNCRAISYLPR